MLHRSLRFLVVLLGFAAPALVAVADPGPMLVQTEAGATLLEQARNHMLYLRLDVAEARLEQLARLEPESPAAPFHLAKIALWRAMILEQDALYETFFERSSRVLDLLKRTPESPWQTHFRAEAELHRAIVHAKKAEYARAAFALRQAYNHFERNLKRHPQFFESYAGMGLCHLTVGLVPRKFRWVLNLLGFDGTIQQGLDELALAAERSRYNQMESAAYYALADISVNESKAGGLRYLADLYRAHRDSPIVGYLYGFALVAERRTEEAEGVLGRAAGRRDAPGTFVMPYIDFYLGEARFRQDDFEGAYRAFDRYLRTFPGQALRAQAALQAGLALEMLGRRDEALPYYERIRVREDYDSDAAARREAERRLQAPMTAHERALLLGQNAFDSGRYREAIRVVQPVLGDADAPAAARAEAAYRSGRAYHLLEEWDEAIRHYRFAVSNPGDRLAKWGPWSQFYIGEAYGAQGNREAARQAYERALAYDEPFEYHKALEQRAKAAIGRL